MGASARNLTADQRPNVFALPCPTTTRAAVFVLAMIAAGMFVGAWIHLQVRGDDWVEVARRCEQVAADSTGSLDPIDAAVEHVVVADRCRRDAERSRSWYLVAGATAPVIGAIIVMALTPALVERRRGLRVPEPGSTAMVRAGELADERGVRSGLRFMFGRTRQRDTFTNHPPTHRPWPLSSPRSAHRGRWASAIVSWRCTRCPPSGSPRCGGPNAPQPRASSMASSPPSWSASSNRCLPRPCTYGSPAAAPRRGPCRSSRPRSA